MKNKLFLSFVLSAFALICSVSASAQTSTQPNLVSTGNGLTKDTVTNTGVKVLGAHLPGSNITVTLSFQTVNISGTQGGTAIPVASGDGVNYYPCGVVFGPSSVTVSSSQLGGVFDVPPGYAYYGVQWTGSGTMSGSITGKVLGRTK